MKTHPLRLLALLLGFVFFAPGAGAAAAGEHYTFVVVHGATAGGWEWKTTGKFLTDDGHTVYRATLTGLGEREHLNSPDIDLQTHINDVVNLILYEDLHDVVLTGQYTMTKYVPAARFRPKASSFVPGSKAALICSLP